MTTVTAAVVGIRAGGREHEAAPVREGHDLLVIARPDHPIDPNAIGVYRVPGGSADADDGADTEAAIEEAGDHLIGYLPADMVRYWEPIDVDLTGGGYAMGKATNVELGPDGQCMQLDVRFEARSR